MRGRGARSEADDAAESATISNIAVASIVVVAPSSQFATAGKDTAVRIYDEQTKQCIVKMERGSGFGPNAAPGHSNRIFALKFHPTDPSVLLSGGWDNTIQIWDCRAGRAQRSIFGPHLCGESLDIQGDVILTGSHRAEDPLETWDYGTGEKVRERYCFWEAAWRFVTRNQLTAPPPPNARRSVA